MIRHPVQRQQATGGGEGTSAATRVDFSQKLSLAEAASSRDSVQHGPELWLQRHRSGMAGQRDRTFGKAAQRADFSTISADAGAPFVRIA